MGGTCKEWNALVEALIDSPDERRGGIASWILVALMCGLGVLIDMDHCTLRRGGLIAQGLKCSRRVSFRNRKRLHGGMARHNWPRVLGGEARVALTVSVLSGACW